MAPRQQTIFSYALKDIWKDNTNLILIATKLVFGDFNMVMKKRLGVPFGNSGSGAVEMPDDKVDVVTDKDNPIFTLEVPTTKCMNIQHWVGKDSIVEVFVSESLTRKGFVIKNHFGFKIYVGVTNDVDTLKATGMPLDVGESFSSAHFIGKVYCIADDIAGLASSDVRVWEEQQ
jgi:hypothetical protein